jgi:hypothetical protein
MNLTFTPDPARLAAFTKEAEEHFYKRYKEALMEQIADRFRVRVSVIDGKAHKEESPMVTMMREQIDTFFLSEKTQARMARYMEEIFPSVMEKCINDALSHATRRQNFTPLVEKAKEELNKSCTGTRLLRCIPDFPATSCARCGREM